MRKCIHLSLFIIWSNTIGYADILPKEMAGEYAFADSYIQMNCAGEGDAKLIITPTHFIFHESCCEIIETAHAKENLFTVKLFCSAEGTEENRTIEVKKRGQNLWIDGNEWVSCQGRY